LLLVVTLRPTSAAIPAVAATVAIPTELLVLLAVAVLSALVAVIAVVAILVRPLVAVTPVFTGTMFALPELARRSLLGLRLARLHEGLARRGGRCRGVLGRDRGQVRRRWGGVIASIRRGIGSPVAIRIGVADGIGWRLIVRTRATATTVRASAFGHATMFVMGCLRAMSRRYRPVWHCGAPVDQEVARKNGMRAREGHE